MKTRRTLLPDPAGFYGLTAFLMLVRFVGPKALQDGDTLWHIRVGQIMLEQRQILREDLFSHTAGGQPWVAHEWLSEVIMAALYNLGGLPGLTMAFFLVTALTFTLLFQTARRLSNDWIAFIVISLSAVPMATTHLFARPHLFTWLLAALTLSLLVANDRRLWLLPLLTMLWANLHGGVLLGLLLQGAFLAGSLLDHWPGRSRADWKDWLQTARRPLLVCVLSFLALGLNPFGYALLWFNFQVNTEIFANAIGEWKSPDFNTLWYMRIWVVWVFVLAAWSVRKTSWTWRLLVPLFIYMAMGHVRHVSIAALFTVPWMALALRDLVDQLPFTFTRRNSNQPQLILSPGVGPAITAVLFVLLFGLSMINPPFWKTWTDARFPMPEEYSAGVIEFLEQGAPGQKLLNEYSWGDYLIFTLDEPPPLFIDGRADMYGEEIFKDYLTVAQLGVDLPLVLEKYAIDWVLFPAQHPLVRHLQMTGNWRDVYTDDKATILVFEPEVSQETPETPPRREETSALN